MDHLNKPVYLKWKREKEGNCNICGTFTNLTWDHVPPQSCFNKDGFKVNPIFEGIPQKNDYKSNMQNGIRYRTICDNCNNNLLGSKYDPSLADFTQEVNNILQSLTILPQTIKIKCKLNKVTRAICGHILAASQEYETKGTVDIKLREYFLNESYLPQQNFSLLIWVYLFKTIIISRGFMLKRVISGTHEYPYPQGVINVISCYPLSYILSTNKENCGLLDLFSICTNSIEDIIEVPIDLSSIYYPNTNIYRELDWPCITADIGGDYLILGHDGLKQSIIASRNMV